MSKSKGKPELYNLPGATAGEMEVAVEQLRRTDPEEAVWIVISMLIKQISHLRHSLGDAESRNQAAYYRLHWRLAGDPDNGKELGGAFGELRDRMARNREEAKEENDRFRQEARTESKALKDQLKTFRNLGTALGGALLSLTVLILAAWISGHFSFVK